MMIYVLQTFQHLRCAGRAQEITTMKTKALRSRPGASGKEWEQD